MTTSRRATSPDQKLPHVLVVIEELADLILAQRKEFTEILARIANVARAAGIHMIAITQRPSVDVLSGKIKANFPARLAFRTVSAADSKTVLLQKGAEQLMGMGDSYLISSDHAGLLRVHAPFTKEADVKKMLDLSLAVGHQHRTPSEASEEEEQQALLNSLKTEEERKAESENATPLDALTKLGKVLIQ